MGHTKVQFFVANKLVGTCQIRSTVLRQKDAVPKVQHGMAHPPEFLIFPYFCKIFAIVTPILATGFTIFSNPIMICTFLNIFESFNKRCQNLSILSLQLLRVISSVVYRHIIVSIMFIVEGKKQRSMPLPGLEVG